MSEWASIPLEDLADDITVGFVGSMTQEYVESGIPFLRSKNVEPYRINFDDIRYIDSDFHQKTKKSALNPGDVVIVRTGKPGSAAIIPESLPIANCSDLVVVRPSSKLDKHFLVYYLNSIAVRHINSRLVGAVQQHFNIGAARELKIHCPEIEEQKEIAAVLSCLDRKIENLRRQNETLEAIAQTLFKHWFVDFEFPNADGKPYKSSGGEMVPSAIGEITADWRVGTLEDIVDVFTGFPFKSDLYSFDSGIRVVRGENVSLGFLRWDTEKRWEHDLDSYSDYFLQKDDYVIGMDGSRVGRNRTIILNADLPLILAQRVARLRAKSLAFSGYVNIFLKQNRFERYVDFIKTGTSIPHISATQIKEFECLIPTGDVVEAFQTFYKPWSEKISSHLEQIETLTKARDVLLPKLMSGKLRISS